MYVYVYEWNVLNELASEKKVFALDTKNNQVFDLLESPMKDVCVLLKLAKDYDNRIIFYYWEEEDEK